MLKGQLAKPSSSSSSSRVLVNHNLQPNFSPGVRTFSTGVRAFSPRVRTFVPGLRTFRPRVKTFSPGVKSLFSFFFNHF